jgi:hypothetical protein
MNTFADSFENNNGWWAYPLDDWPDDVLYAALVWLGILRERPSWPFIPYSRSEAMAGYALHASGRAVIWHLADGGFELRRRQEVSR